MDNQKKCDKYEAFFIFSDEKAFYEHLESCDECFNEHKKYLKVSKLIKEAAPAYLKREHTKKLNTVKKLACCFIAFIGITAFSGVKMYNDSSFQINSMNESYIGTLGLPVDDYGFLEI